LASLREREGITTLLLSNKKCIDYLKKYDLQIGGNTFPGTILALMIKEEWISPSWLQFKKEFFNDRFSQNYVFRGINHFDGAAYKRLLRHGNDRFVKDGKPLFFQSKIVGQGKLTPGDFIWGSVSFNKAWNYTRGQNIRVVCVYDKNKLLTISESDGYAWRLAPSEWSWKDALVGVIVFVFKQK